MSHHPFSPSRLGRRALCPGSYRMEKDLVEPAESEAATEGTLLHRWMAQDDGAADLEAAVESGALRADHAPLVRRCRRFVREPGSGVEVYREIAMDLTHDDGAVLSRGTADQVAVMDGLVAEVTDWKFGRIPVSPVSGALQVGTYAAMAFQRFPQVHTVLARIFQPRTGAEFVEEFTRTPVEGRMCLPDIASEIAKVIEAAEHPDAPLRPSPEACEFCLAAPACPALHELVRSRVVAKRGVPAFEALAPDERREAVLLCRMAKGLAQAGLDAAKEYIRGGGEIPGCSVETNPGNRKIDDALGAFALVSPLLNETDFLGATKVSVTELQKRYATACREKGITSTKKAGEERFAEVMGDAITRGEDKHTLVIER